VNENGHHFKFYDQFNPGQFLNKEMQTFVMTQQLVGIATGLGINLDIAFELAKDFTYVSDHRSLNTCKLRLLQDEYNAHRQTKSQEFIERLATWRSEKALIRKYEEMRDQCLPDEIEKANALIAKRANRKRKRTDDMLETEERKAANKRKAEATRLEAEEQAAFNRAERAEKQAADEERAAFNRAERAKKQDAKLASIKLEVENNFAERAAIMHAEEKERVAAAKEAVDKLAAVTNCTERASLSKIDSQWEDMFEFLVMYIEETRETATGHMNDEQKAEWIWNGNVPFSYKTPCGKALGVWISKQRAAKAKEKLKDNRELRLTSKCLRWNMK
jgi:hypothetical protein